MLRRINTYLTRWLMKKYKRYGTWKKAARALDATLAETTATVLRSLGLGETGRQMTRTAGAV